MSELPPPIPPQPNSSVPPPPPGPAVGSAPGAVYSFGPRAREIFVATFGLLARCWRQMILIGLVMIVGQAVTWWLVAEGLDDVFMGDFYEAADRGLAMSTGRTFTPDPAIEFARDIEFFENLEVHFPVSAIFPLVGAVVIAVLSYLVAQIGWLRTLIAAKNGRSLPIAQAAADVVTLSPRAIGTGLVLGIPFVLFVGGLVVVAVIEPLLLILGLPLLVIVAIFWLLYASMALVTSAVASRETRVLRTAFATVNRRRTHAFKCLLMTFLPAAVVGFGGGMLGQLGLVFGVVGYVAMSILSAVVQSAVTTSSYAAMYVSLGGETDEALRPVAV